MSRYQPLPSASSPTSARPSTASARPSLASLRFGSSSRARSGQAIPIPDEDDRQREMDAAFDGPDDEDEEEDERGESRGLLSRDRDRERERDRDRERDRSRGAGRQDERMVGQGMGDGAGAGRIPGDYDFNAPPEYTFPHSAANPAEGNSNGLIPTSAPLVPGGGGGRQFLGGILPTAFLPRRASPQPGARVLGQGNSGIFGNLAARPDGPRGGAGGPTAGEGEEGGFVPETEQKEGPPSYQAALRDAVPPYWDTTVVLPSSNSPWGPLHSSMSGDEILIDGMPSGNMFGFVWNLIVSFAFQFVGFLLTYILHTTHAAKYGSRVGLGLTLVQFGFTLRSRALDLIETGEFPDGELAANDPSATTPEEISAENAIEAYYGPASPWPARITDHSLPQGADVVIIHNIHEAELYAERHNITLQEFLALPTAEEVGHANEWFSFILMSIGWVVILTSLGGLWRVKRFEKGLRAAQRESERAQAEANGTATTASNAAGDAGEGGEGGEGGQGGWTAYTRVFRDWAAGARDVQRGFFGMRGRRMNGTSASGGGGSGGGADDEHELLDAQGFGLGPMASDSETRGQEAARRGRGLWG